MRPIVSLLLLAGCAAAVCAAPAGQHKSEAEIARLTPAQRVDAWVGEQVRHRHDLSDDHDELIKKYIMRDGLAALPRVIEIMDEYDPARARAGRSGERFDACWLLLGYMDQLAVRLRGSGEGRRAMDALERAVGRMRAAGHGQRGQHDWGRHGRFGLAATYLEEAKGVGLADRAIRDTLWVRYKIRMSDPELRALSDFLVARDPTYPGWSDSDLIKDHTRHNAAGYPLQVYVMKKPEPFYEAYLEFKKARP